MRRFHLRRHHDVSGISGTGTVADGVLFTDGVTVLHWRGDKRSTVIWKSLSDMIQVHGHDGYTEVVWID